MRCSAGQKISAHQILSWNQTVSYTHLANSVVSVEGDAGSAEGSVETDGGGSGDDTAAPGEEES